ncbi:HIT family hydrolase [Bacillus cereus]|nr:HIT family hydrolase [Bacillus cereus]
MPTNNQEEQNCFICEKHKGNITVPGGAIYDIFPYMDRSDLIVYFFAFASLNIVHLIHFAIFVHFHALYKCENKVLYHMVYTYTCSMAQYFYVVFSKPVADFIALPCHAEYHCVFFSFLIRFLMLSYTTHLYVCCLLSVVSTQPSSLYTNLLQSHFVIPL